MPSLSAVSALSSHSASHTDYSALCRVLSCAPTAPALPPGNPALSFYIPRSDCGLYCCFPLSAPKGMWRRTVGGFSPPCCHHTSIQGGKITLCSLLFLDIKKPQPLDFSKDCGAYFTYLALITRLLNDSSHTTRTNCSTTLTD